MNLELRDKTLDLVTIDYTVLMKLSDEYLIRIESPFTLHSQDQRIVLSPEEYSTEDCAPMRNLLGQAVREATISDAGALSVVFHGGVRIIVGPDSDYEAWTVSGPNGLLIVCMPGGELARWGAEPQIDI